LKDSINKFQTLTNADFIVRIAKNEAAIYGQKVLTLLERAKTNLCEKFGFKLDKPTIVEIFPEQKDFAVRTFGMPGNPGYLGVCFGSVITANSPAAQTGHPANWEAVLWHEFCHVVTLQMTRNKMPRWLSEGISVFEEMQANPTWGQAMNPRYREMVMSGELTPVGKLSAAFLAPKTSHHLQFAYYESSLVVEFLVKQFGQESLQQILRDLGNGVEINSAIATNTAPLEKIEKDFAAFARQRAEQLAPALDFSKTKSDGLEKLPDDLQFDWTGKSASNYWALTQKARKLLVEKKWEEAKAPLKKLIEAYPGQTGADNAYSLLAEVHRGLHETNLEYEVLSKLAALSADATDAYLRLMELGAAKKDWPVVLQNAERFLAVNPLIPQPHRFLAQASEALGKNDQAIQSYQVLLLLDPPDPADAHFRLARLLHQTGDPSAKRHVLQALEEAPRFREAHRLLLELTGDLPSHKTNAATINQDKKL
jgi:tetratricopeptide (TPR) repeat protein